MATLSFQLYSARNGPPLSDMLQCLARLGVTAVEGYDGLLRDDGSVAVLARELEATGLSMPTAHIGLPMLEDEPDRVLTIARTLGIETVIVPSLPLDERVKDRAGWAAFGRRLAAVAEPILAAGLNLAWHNHAFEFEALDDVDRPIDLILAADDRIGWQIDVAWIARAGDDPLPWIDKHRARIVAAHLKDVAPSGTMQEDGWADFGYGTLDWPPLLAALGKTKASILVLEHDNPSDPNRFASRSITAARVLMAA